MDQSIPSAMAGSIESAGFKIVELAARGGSGSVYQAVETATEETVAIKVLDRGVDQERLDREQRLMSQVDHAAIPRIRHFGTAGEHRFLVTEWVDGMTLSAALGRAGSITPKRALHLFDQLASGLDAIHAAGVVHGDLSTDNVLVGPNDEVSLIDFGVSRSLTAETITHLDMASGTPRFVAPEVLETSTTSPASDQYSSAVILYEMLTGVWPYPDSGNNVATTLHHHLHTDPIPASEANQWLPGHLDDALQRALSKQPEERFRTVGEFAVALRHVGDATAGGPNRTNVMLALGGIAAAVVVGVFILVWAVGRTDPPADAEAVYSVVAWEAGFAESLDCNLLSQAGFDSGELDPGYFDGEASKNAISSIGGVDQTRALQVGVTDEYGLYGERVPADPGVVYVFSANVSRSGPPGTMIMRIGWLDEDFVALDEEARFVLGEEALGQTTVRSPAAPADARYAVAILENSSSEGIFVADELVFARADDSCADRLFR